MLDPVGLLVDAVVDRVLAALEEQCPGREPAYRQLLEDESRRALAQISRSDALYHDLHHTALVTDAGLAILEGWRHDGKPVAPRAWLHCVLSLLLHDIGNVGGVCRADRDGVRASGRDGETIRPPRGATDAYLAPYHVDRGKLHVRERFAGHEIVDPEILAANIERTRFPVPEDAEHQASSDLPGLVRAADLIGQLADPGRDRKLPALFYEFEEVGLNAQLGFSTPGDLKADNSRFFRSAVAPYLEASLIALEATAEGRLWIANLLSNMVGVDSVEGILMQRGAEPPTSSSAES